MGTKCVKLLETSDLLGESKSDAQRVYCNCKRRTDKECPICLALLRCPAFELVARWRLVEKSNREVALNRVATGFKTKTGLECCGVTRCTVLYRNGTSTKIGSESNVGLGKSCAQNPPAPDLLLPSKFNVLCVDGCKGALRHAVQHAAAQQCWFACAE